MIGRVPVAGNRKRTRAFIKVQDGCDNHCTYCVTRLARGSSRSVPVEQVIADVNSAITGGVQEAVLTGVQIGAWGRDLSPVDAPGRLGEGHPVTYSHPALADQLDRTLGGG